MTQIIDVPINNSYILESLDDFLWYYENKDLVRENVRLHGNNADQNRFTEETYRDKIVKMAERHDGYPEDLHSYSLKRDRISFLNKASQKNRALFIEKYSKLNSNLASSICVKNNALTNLYPPGGYISWHNNANAPGYNFIFSWSETGDGSFSYIDGETGKEVVMQDKQGWNCKAGYFGHYRDSWNKLCYHSAKTNCWRLTVSFILNMDETGMGMQQEVIEEIMSDF